MEFLKPNNIHPEESKVKNDRITTYIDAEFDTRFDVSDEAFAQPFLSPSSLLIIDSVVVHVAHKKCIFDIKCVQAYTNMYVDAA